MTLLVRFLPRPPSSTINLVSVPLVLLSPECHVSRLMKYVAFCICLFPFGTMCLLFIHVVACVDCPLLFNAEQNYIVRLHLLVCSSSKLVCVTVRRHCVYILVGFFCFVFPIRHYGRESPRDAILGSKTPILMPQ